MRRASVRKWRRRTPACSSSWAACGRAWRQGPAGQSRAPEERVAGVGTAGKASGPQTGLQNSPALRSLLRSAHFLALFCPPPQRKESENEGLGQRVAALSSQVEGLSNAASLHAGGPAALQKKLWDLESRALEQQQELSQQTKAVEQLEQVRPLLATLWPPVPAGGEARPNICPPSSWPFSSFT